MIKFIKKIALFFALMAVIDVACGFGFNVLRRNAKGGDTHKNYYIAEECCDDILILGSSRAARHYDPKVLEDSLGMTCFNCGEPGCGIITAYARYQMIATRHKPKIVLYEVSPLYDYYILDDNSKYLGRVRQYADKAPVRKLFLELGDDLEGLRLLSNMYINNSFLFHNVIDCLMDDGNYKGFKPLYGTLKNDSKNSPKGNNNWQIDSVKYSYLEDLIRVLKIDGVNFCFMVSPRCIGKDEAALQDSDYVPIADLCKHYGVPFINHTYLDSISNRREFFQDFGHMNQDGARAYSIVASQDLKSIIMK